MEKCKLNLYNGTRADRESLSDGWIEQGSIFIQAEKSSTSDDIILSIWQYMYHNEDTWVLLESRSINPKEDGIAYRVNTKEDLDKLVGMKEKDYAFVEDERLIYQYLGTAWQWCPEFAGSDTSV